MSVWKSSNLISRLISHSHGHAFKIQNHYYANTSAIFNYIRDLTFQDSLKQNFKIPSPEYINFARDFIDGWASVDKETSNKQLAYWFLYKNGKEVKWTYEEVAVHSKKTANALIQMGAGTTWNRCLVILPKLPEWWLINVACMRLGTILVPTTSLATPKDIQYRLQASRAQCIFTTPKLAEAVERIESTCPQLKTKILVSSDSMPRIGWQNFHENYIKASEEHQCVDTKKDDIFQIFFTSGTTGLPKRVVQTHGGTPLGLAHFARFMLKLERNYVFWNMADTGWAKSLWSSIIIPGIAGATAFVHDMPQFDPQLTLQILERYPIDVLCAPPTVYRMLVAQTESPKLKSLKQCLSGGEPLNPEILKKWKSATQITMQQAFGQTETPPLIGDRPESPNKIGSMGTACPGITIGIVDSTGKELPTGTPGIIAVKVVPEKPAGLFKEYEDDPERTAKSYVGDWYLTGDRGHVDEDGYFWYECRDDDIITSSAYRIGPYEVESALQEHPDVLESAVIGVPDPERTEIVKAFIILKPSGKTKDPEILKTEIQSHVKRVTAPYKYPRQIEFVESLPKTVSGKIKRAELRTMHK